MATIAIIDDNEKSNNQSNLNSETSRIISKFNVHGDDYLIRDGEAREQIYSLEDRIKDIEECLGIIKSEIKQINKKLNNETFNFN